MKLTDLITVDKAADKLKVNRSYLYMLIRMNEQSKIIRGRKVEFIKVDERNFCRVL